MSQNIDERSCSMDRRTFLGAAMAGGALLAAGPLAWTRLANAAGQAVALPPLPYAEDALEPYISARTISFHYGKHHNGYVTKTNKLLENSDLKGESLETVIMKAARDPEMTALYNNAAQVWNHTFYWNSMRPGGGGKPEAPLLEQIVADFGGMEDLEKALAAEATGQFGSGWAWLVVSNGKLGCINTPNADTPIALGMTPLLCIDVWEHAYYLDYQNKRGEYVKNFLAHLANWDFANQNFQQAG